MEKHFQLAGRKEEKQKKFGFLPTVRTKRLVASATTRKTDGEVWRSPDRPPRRRRPEEGVRR